MGGSVGNPERVNERTEVFQGREHRRFAHEHEDAESKQGQNAAGTRGVRLVAAICSPVLGFDAGEHDDEIGERGEKQEDASSVGVPSSAVDVPAIADALGVTKGFLDLPALMRR